MTKRDLYVVLGVAREASADEIKQAYRKLALEHHPDVNPGDAESEERFKEISAAKEILLSDEKRKLYDEFGMDGLASGFDVAQARTYHDWTQRAKQSPGFGSFDTSSAGGQGIEDLLSQLFRAQAGKGLGDEFTNAQDPRFRRQPEANPAADAETELEVDFTDAVSGSDIQMRIEGRKPLRVTIPRGARDGTRIRLKGQGVNLAGAGKVGDLYIRLKLRPHPFFRRDGDDLHADLPVTVPELVLGAEVEIPTPDGKTTVKIPPYSANEQTLRLPGLGVFRLGAKGNAKSDRGHLFLHLKALLPTEGGAELEDLVKKFEDAYGDQDPRAEIRWESKQ